MRVPIQEIGAQRFSPRRAERFFRAWGADFGYAPGALAPYKEFASVLVCLVQLAAPVLAGCAVATPPPTNQPVVDATPAPVHFVGRVERTSPTTARYAWSGTGFVVEFTGTGLVAQLKDDKNEHQIVVDGKATGKVQTVAEKTDYVLAEALPVGAHQVQLLRRTEALFGPTELLGVKVLGGELSTVKTTPARRIEVVGDSITCGYGNLGTEPQCPFSASTEDHYQSYGALIARQYGAEVSTVAWSGRGVVRNYDGGAGAHMGELYQRILPESADSRYAEALPYDAVIVNLGTNDYSTTGNPGQAHFQAEYAALLEQIRKQHPTAFILCTLGPMLGGEGLEQAESAIRGAVAQFAARGDSRVTYHRMATSNQSPGCDWHPSVGTHRQMAAELGGILARSLGW